MVDAPHAKHVQKPETGTQLWPVVAYATDLDVVDPIHLDEKTDKLIQLVRSSFGMASQAQMMGGGPKEVTATQMLVIQPIRMVRNQLLLFLMTFINRVVLLVVILHVLEVDGKRGRRARWTGFEIHNRQRNVVPTNGRFSEQTQGRSQVTVM